MASKDPDLASNRAMSPKEVGPATRSRRPKLVEALSHIDKRRSGSATRTQPKRRKAHIAKSASAINRFPAELLVMVFVDVVAPCVNARHLLQALERLTKVCQAWKGATSILPLPPRLVVTTASQARRLAAAFQEGALAGRSVVSLALLPNISIDHRRGSDGLAIHDLTKPSGLILGLCTNIVELSIVGRAKEYKSDLSTSSVFADEFLLPSSLARLRKLEIRIWGLPKNPELPGPPDKLSATAPYNLTSFDYGGGDYVSGDRQSGSFLRFAFGRPGRLNRLILPSKFSWLPEILPISAPPVQVVSSALLHSLSKVSCLRDARTCVVTLSISRAELQLIASSGITELRVPNFPASAPWFSSGTLVPFLESDASATITNVQVEYVYPQHYDSLDSLEVIEDACIARGIEFELVSKI